MKRTGVAAKYIATLAVGVCAGLAVSSLRLPKGANNAADALAKVSTATTVLSGAAPGQAHSLIATAGATSAAPSASAGVHADNRGLGNTAGGQASGIHTADGGDEFSKATAPGSEKFAAIFANDAVDEQWASQATSSLRASIDALPARSTFGNVDIECHSTLCRVSISDTATDAAGANAINNLEVALSQFATAPPGSEAFDGSAETMSNDKDTGAVKLDYYLHRKPFGVGLHSSASI